VRLRPGRLAACAWPPRAFVSLFVKGSGAIENACVLSRTFLFVAGLLLMSPIALAGHVEHGEANRFIHIWAYQSLDERAAIRNKAREMGVWPPPGGSDTLLTMANKIMMPSAFSPVQ